MFAFDQLAIPKGIENLVTGFLPHHQDHMSGNRQQVHSDSSLLGYFCIQSAEHKRHSAPTFNGTRQGRVSGHGAIVISSGEPAFTEEVVRKYASGRRTPASQALAHGGSHGFHRAPIWPRVEFWVDELVQSRQGLAQ